MKKNYLNVTIIVILIFILCFSLFVTYDITNNVISFTELFFKRLFPLSFLFFVISNMLIEYNFIYYLQKLLKTNSVYLYVFIVSLISGFPSGAMIINELYKKGIIKEDVANKMIMYAHFPNPLFVINSVSLVINKKYSFIILVSIICSNIIIYLFIKKERVVIDEKINNDISFGKVFSASINKAFKTIVIVYGVSLIFYIFSYFISGIFKDFIYLYVFFNGLFDLTKGCFSVSIIKSNFIKSIYILFFICFGSFSIHMQNKSILSDTSISYSKFVVGRVLGFILSVILFLLFILIVNWCGNIYGIFCS